MAESRKMKHRNKLIAGVAAAGLLGLTATTGAHAFTPNVAREVAHFVECFGWMLTAPDVHAANCLPSNQVPTLESLASPGEGGAPPQPLPPPPDDYSDFDDSIDDSFLDSQAFK